MAISVRSFVLMTAVVLVGCGGDARMELAASDAMMALARQMESAAVEYHREVEVGDDLRESAVVDAFVRRVRMDHADDAAMDGHVDAFGLALNRVRSDRRVEWQRSSAVLSNVAVMRELADGLRESAWQSMTLSDEFRRYLRRWSTVGDAANGANAIVDEQLAEMGGGK